MTELKGHCTLQADYSFSRDRNIPCTQVHYDQFNCEDNRNVRNEFIALIANPQTCFTVNSQTKLCITRSKVLAQFELDLLRCDHQNKQVSIMATTVNKARCQYSTHSFSGLTRRIWTESRFEDCHNAEESGSKTCFVEIISGSFWVRTNLNRVRSEFGRVRSESVWDRVKFI